MIATILISAVLILVALLVGFSMGVNKGRRDGVPLEKLKVLLLFYQERLKMVGDSETGSIEYARLEGRVSLLLSLCYYCFQRASGTNTW